MLRVGILFPADIAAPLALIEEHEAKYSDDTERDDKVPDHRQLCDGLEDIEYHDFLIYWL